MRNIRRNDWLSLTHQAAIFMVSRFVANFPRTRSHFRLSKPCRLYWRNSVNAEFALRCVISPDYRPADTPERRLPLHNRLSTFHHPRHIPSAFRASPNQQQVTCLDGTIEIPDGHLTTALAAPDVGEQRLLGLGRNACPKLGGLGGELGNGLDGHGNKSSAGLSS